MMRITEQETAGIKSMMVPIIWGSFLLVLCSIIHLIILVFWAKSFQQINNLISKFWISTRVLAVSSCTTAVIVISHTIQVWLWALALVILGALPDAADAVYFSLVTYTTLGYGDITLNQDFRIFGAMEAVTGLLNFGLSTAFLVSVITRLLADLLKTD